MEYLTDAEERKFYQARYKLHQMQPFVAQLAFYLKPQIVKDIPTMAVNANGDLFINRDFYAKLEQKDLLWVLTHEVMHLVTMTHGRMPIGANHTIFNIASDAVINHMITDDLGLQIINPNICQPIYGGQFSKYKNATTEQAYYDLMKNAKKIFKSDPDKMGEGEFGHSGGSKGKGQYWWDDSASRVNKKANTQGTDENGNAKSDTGGMTEEQKSQWKQRIASAATAAKMAGKMPGALDQFVTTLLAPNKDWRNELRAMTQTALKTQHTWKIPSRRTVGIGLRTPGKEKSVPTAICYIDTSGSMSDVELQRCLSEVSRIFSICGGKGLLILGDAEIYYAGEMEANQLNRLQKVQRGGTDFCVLFDYIKENLQKDPAILIGFTDLCGPFPQTPPNFPVVWCVPKNSYSGQSKAPWGRTIEVDV